MAFFSKVGNVLKQHVGKQISSQFSQSNPSVYQALRCMSSSKLFIGGLPYVVDGTTLHDTFSQYGQVVEAKVIMDRETNRSRGFGFVTFTSSEEAASAIQALDGQDFQGRTVKVSYANDRAPRQPGGGGYGGGGFGGGGYGGGGYGGGGYSGGGGGSGYGGSSGGGGYSGGGSYGGGESGYGGSSGGYGGGYGSNNSNVTADTGFASSGFEQGSSLGYDDSNQFRSNATGADYEASGSLEESFGNDDQPDDFAKRA